MGDSTRIVNVGAGTGSYEPTGRAVVAVEPSPVMIAQRPSGSAGVVRAVAEHLPFPDRSFDASLVILAIHHWSDVSAGLSELRRVARRHVLLGFDRRLEHRFWLVTDYLPEIADIDYGSNLGVDDVADALGPVEVQVLPVPHDCTDGFLGAYWQRPEAYLDPEVQRCISGMALLEPAVLQRGIGRLRDDLRSGAWRRRHGDLLELDEVDLGYRLLIAG